MEMNRELLESAKKDLEAGKMRDMQQIVAENIKLSYFWSKSILMLIETLLVIFLLLVFSVTSASESVTSPNFVKIFLNLCSCHTLTVETVFGLILVMILSCGAADQKTETIICGW